MFTNIKSDRDAVCVNTVNYHIQFGAKSSITVYSITLGRLKWEEKSMLGKALGESV